MAGNPPRACLPRAWTWAAIVVVAYALGGVLVWLSAHAEGWIAVARGAEAPTREIIGGGARAS